VKRSAALAPLSRDHHHALVVARALSRADPAGAGAAADRFVAFMGDDGLRHFALEEEVLAPLVPADVPEQALVARMLEDHRRLRESWRRLRGRSAPPEIDALHDLGVRLRAHVRMEEEELFPYLEASLDAAVLEQVGVRLESGGSGADEPEVVVVVRRFLDAFLARDLAALIAAADPSIELRPLRLTASAGYHGHDGLAQWLEDLAGLPVSPEFTVEEVEMRDAERAAVRVCVTIGGEALRVTAVFTVRGGVVRDVAGYFSDEDLLETVGAL
jgi:hypothetical protein